MRTWTSEPTDPATQLITVDYLLELIADIEAGKVSHLTITVDRKDET